eukprot:scaffold316196_cov59-Attheya_sp.AAC.2
MKSYLHNDLSEKRTLSTLALGSMVGSSDFRTATSNLTALEPDLRRSVKFTNNNGKGVPLDVRLDATRQLNRDLTRLMKAPNDPDLAEEMLRNHWIWLDPASCGSSGLDSSEMAAPNAVSFSIVMTAWAHSDRPEAAERIHQLFGALRKFYHDQQLMEAPTLRTYSVLLNALSRCACSNVNQNRLSKSYKAYFPKMVDIILEDMKEACRVDEEKCMSTYALSSAMRVYATFRLTGKAEHTLFQLEHVYLQENQGIETLPAKNHTMLWKKSAENNAWINRKHYYSVISALAQNDHKWKTVERMQCIVQRMEKMAEMGHIQCRPDVGIYSHVLFAMAKSGHALAGPKAQELLDYMRHECYNNGKHWLEPNTVLCNSVLEAWSRSKNRTEAAINANQLVQWMEGDAAINVCADVQTFNFLLHTLARCGTREAAMKADEIINRLLMEQNEKGTVTLNDVTITCAMKAWADSGSRDAPVRAESLLEQRIQLYNSNSFVGTLLPPSVLEYNVVLDTHAKSRQSGQHAWQRVTYWLKRMNDESNHGATQPDFVTLSTVLKSWAKCNEEGHYRQSSYDIVMNIMHEVQQSSLVTDHQSRRGWTPQTANAFEVLVLGFARNGKRSFLLMAHEVLKFLVDQGNRVENDEHQRSVQPDHKTFSILMSAFLRIGDLDSAGQVMQLEHSMLCYKLPDTVLVEASKSKRMKQLHRSSRNDQNKRAMP